MSREPRDSRIALFIDFENLVTRTGIEPEQFDLQPALDKLLERGKVVFRRAYADWSRFQGAKKHLHDKGVELIDVPPSTRSGKNGADIRLVVDALELAYQREHMDTFAIASGDSDFCPLAYKLRENNRYVVGLAVRESTSPLFVKACDEFLYMRPAGGRPARSEKPARAEKQTESESAPAEPRAKGRGRRRGKKSEEVAEEVAGPRAETAAAPESTTAEPRPKGRRRRGKKAEERPEETVAEGAEAPPPEKPEEAVAAPPPAEKPLRKKAEVPPFARDAALSILSGATEPVNPSAIKQAIVRRQPDFDEREFGFSSFSRLLEALEKEGVLKREQGSKGQWYVVPA